MVAYLKTRSRSIDYGYVGGAPAASWWSERRWIRVNAHMSGVLVEGMGGPWRAIVSGITSERRDKTERTLIRYDLVFEAAGPTPQKAEQVCALLLRWITVRNERSGLPPRHTPDLGGVLDRFFYDDDRLDHLLKVHTEETIAAVRRDIDSALDLYAQNPAPQGAPSSAPAWAAGSTASGAAALFVAEARALMNGERGQAVLGDIITNESLPSATPGERLAVLVENSDLTWRELTVPKSLGEVTDSGPPESPYIDPRKKDLIDPKHCGRSLAAALALLLVVFLVVLLLT